MTRFALLRPVVALLVAGLAGCGGDLTLPDSSAVGLGLEVLRGNGQAGTVGEPLPAPVVVRVASEAGEPISGRKVAFVAAGGGTEAFDPDTAVTDSKGEALTHWVLGTEPGTYVGEARIVAEGDTTLKTVSFQADAHPGVPDTVRATGPTSQPGRRGQALAEPLSVIVVDRFGNPIGGVEVGWRTADDDDGELSPESAPTGTDGISSVTWTLGSSVGVQRAEARVDGTSGSPISFTAVTLF
jgi:hypothetical protein